jgi:hypothetical protein
MQQLAISNEGLAQIEQKFKRNPNKKLRESDRRILLVPGKETGLTAQENEP